MAKREHVNLIRQGIIVWNEWREKHPDIQPDLRRANLRAIHGHTPYVTFNPKRISVMKLNLSHANLQDAYFGKAELVAADFSYSDLEGAYFGDANLSQADFSYANLHKAQFIQSISISTDFSDADLSETAFNNALLYMTNFSSTNLTGSDFVQAHLLYCNLNGADLTNARVGLTTFGNMKLNTVKGLETVEHNGHSVIGTNTLLLPRDSSTEVFLRSAGVPNEFIEYTRPDTMPQIEYQSCFISYSTKNEDFVQSLHTDLQNYGVVCFYAPIDMKTGDEILQTIDKAIEKHNKLLLVLSQESLESQWVEYEVKVAFAKERQEQRTVLFPICLDDTIMKSTNSWAEEIRAKVIANFEQWQDKAHYNGLLAKVTLLGNFLKLRDKASEKSRRVWERDHPHRAMPRHVLR